VAAYDRRLGDMIAAMIYRCGEMSQTPGVAGQPQFDLWDVGAE